MIEGLGPSMFNRPAPEKKKKKSHKPSPASTLTDEVIRFVKANGGTARRVNSMGIYDDVLGKWRTSMTRRGYEDVDATMCVTFGKLKFGFKIGVEIKIGSDTQSQYQKKRQQELEAAGGQYWIIKDFDTFTKTYSDYMLYIKKTLSFNIFR